MDVLKDGKKLLAKMLEVVKKLLFKLFCIFSSDFFPLAIFPSAFFPGHFFRGLSFARFEFYSCVLTNVPHKQMECAGSSERSCERK